MEEATVTQLWMAGVIGVMLAYAALALIGLAKRAKARDEGNTGRE